MFVQIVIEYPRRLDENLGYVNYYRKHSANESRLQMHQRHLDRRICFREPNSALEAEFSLGWVRLEP